MYYELKILLLSIQDQSKSIDLLMAFAILYFEIKSIYYIIFHIYSYFLNFTFVISQDTNDNNK